MKSLLPFFLLLIFHVKEILIELSTQRKSTRSQWIFFTTTKKFFQLTEKTLSRFLIVQQKRKDEIEVKRAKVLTYCVQV